MEPKNVSQTARSEYMDQLIKLGTSKKGTSLTVKDGKVEQIGRIKTLINKITGKESRLREEDDALQKATMSFLQDGLERKWLTNSHKKLIQTIAERAGLTDDSEYKNLLENVDKETKNQLDFYKFIQPDINNAIRGDENAIYNLGTAFYRNYEKTRNREDLVEAKKWLEKGKEKSHEDSITKLAEIAAMEGDKLLSVNLYAQAAESGKLLRIRKSAKEWFKFEDFDEAIKQWQRAVDLHNDPVSMLKLAKFYEKDHTNYPQDLKKAREWYTEAAKKGISSAASWLEENPEKK